MVRPGARRALLALGLASGCFNAGVYPRSGRVADAGEWTGGIQVTVFSFGAGRLASGERANSGRRAAGWMIGSVPYWLFYPLVNGQAFVRYGIAGEGEIGSYFGLQEIAIEGRYQLVDRDRAAATLAFAAALRNVDGRGKPWLRAGVDYGHDTDDLEPRTGLHLTWGAETRFAQAGAASAFSARNELRVQVPIALGFGPAHGRGVAGAVAYAVLVQGAPLRSPLPADIDERWGFHLVLGGEAR